MSFGSETEPPDLADKDESQIGRFPRRIPLESQTPTTFPRRATGLPSTRLLQNCVSANRRWAPKTYDRCIPARTRSEFSKTFTRNTVWIVDVLSGIRKLLWGRMIRQAHARLVRIVVSLPLMMIIGRQTPATGQRTSHKVKPRVKRRLRDLCAWSARTRTLTFQLTALPGRDLLSDILKQLGNATLILGRVVASQRDP